MEFYLAKKNQFIKSLDKWTELEKNMLGEVTQAQKDKYYLFLLICKSYQLFSFMCLT